MGGSATGATNGGVQSAGEETGPPARYSLPGIRQASRCLGGGDARVVDHNVELRRASKPGGQEPILIGKVQLNPNERAALQKLSPDMVRITGTDLRGAGLSSEYLEGVDLGGAHLEGADLFIAHLEDAYLFEAHLEGTDLVGAYLEGVDLSTAYGDAKTRLPDGFPRPAHWPPFDESS